MRIKPKRKPMDVSEFYNVGELVRGTKKDSPYARFRKENQTMYFKCCVYVLYICQTRRRRFGLSKAGVVT